MGPGMMGGWGIGWLGMIFMMTFWVLLIVSLVCQSKDGKQEKVFDALEWLAAMCSHVPDKGEQMVRYGACPPLAELL